MEKYITSDKIFYHLEDLNSWKNNCNVSPITMELHLSNACNNNCYYCCMDKVKDTQIMSEEQTKQAIGFIKKIGAKAIIFSGGGEPTVSPHFDDALFYASEKELDIGVITNGLNLYDQRINDILGRASWVRVSLDAVNPRQYEQIRGSDSFNTAVSNLKKLVETKKELKYGCTVGTQIVVNKYNYKTIREFVNFVTKNIPGIDYIQVRPLEVLPSEDPYPLDMLNEIKPQLNQIKINKKVIVSAKWDLFWDNPNREYGYSACHCAEFIGAIDAYGDYYLCCHTIKNPAYKALNIFDVKYLPKFFLRRDRMINDLGPSKGLNRAFCPVMCRGASLNRRLEGLLNEPEHKNFL